MTVDTWSIVLITCSKAYLPTDKLWYVIPSHAVYSVMSIQRDEFEQLSFLIPRFLWYRMCGVVVELEVVNVWVRHSYVI